MADPFTWITIASAAVGAVGAIQQGNAASASAKSQAHAADYNAAVSRNQAQQSLQVSAAEQLALSRKQRQFFGMQRAAIAQSGTGFGGSNADILEQSGTLAELELLNIAYEGDLRSKGFMAQSTLDTFQAGAARRNASAARTAGYLGAGAVFANAARRSILTDQAPAPVTDLNPPRLSLNRFGY
jgi:hypothetical protein